MRDLISIIVPVYNMEKYIEQCINSIINQTYKNIEIILIDNGSTDGSSLICDNYANKDNRIIIIHNNKKSVGLARNIGIDNANGKYIVFVDADDFIENDYCEIMLNTLKREKVDCVVCGYNRIYKDRKVKITHKTSYKLNNIQFLQNILYVQQGLGFCHTKIWKTSTIKNIKFNENLKVGEDALFCIEASKNIKEVYVLNKQLYNYRFNKNSVVRKYDNFYVDKYLESMKITKQYIELNYVGNEEIIKRLNNYIAYHILIISINYCFNPKNNLNYLNQIKKLKEICNIKEFKETIKNSTYTGFSITRKIMLFTLKHKLYFFSMVIGKIRQIQFLKDNKE